ncbi:5549_t:CDS:2, partial [Ambispora leptoticha]
RFGITIDSIIFPDSYTMVAALSPQNVTEFYKMRKIPQNYKIWPINSGRESGTPGKKYTKTLMQDIEERQVIFSTIQIPTPTVTQNVTISNTLTTISTSTVTYTQTITPSYFSDSNVITQDIVTIVLI